MCEFEENEDLDLLYYQEIMDEPEVRSSGEDGNVGCLTILFFILGVIIL